MRRIINLEGYGWELGQVTQRPFGDVNDVADVREWLPAKVPGDVRLDLLAAGKIADPYYGKQNETSQWVDASDWWYRREVELDVDKDERAFLVLHGVDYQSAVFWNGAALGRHVGMFSRQVYELPKGDEKKSSLAVRVWGSDALPKMTLSKGQRLWQRVLGPLYPITNEPLPDRYATLKCQMQFGWDFAPRLRTCGIWDAAEIIVVRSVLIRDAHVRTTSLNAATGQATLEADVTFDADHGSAVGVEIVARRRGSDTAQRFEFEIDLVQGNQTRPFTFILQDAALWNPWDRGEPNLYDVEFVVKMPDAGAGLDTYHVSFGVRTIELVVPEKSRTGEPWTIMVNGKREFIRGVNWAPMDSMPGRLTRDDYAARLAQAREANANFLRVWGGGLREKQAFYDVCDELGILVWQEFPFSGAILDRFPTDPSHLDFVRGECASIVQEIRNHPSLVVWSGGNEFNTQGNGKIVETLRTAVAENDPGRPFKPASPYRDEEHYWRVWHRQANLRDYQKTETPFLSEFGLQAPPAIESLARFMPSDKLFPPNEMWVYHRAELDKLFRYARVMDPTADTLERFVDASQRAQALGIQVAIEHMRRRKGRTSGVAVWQLDDPWPAISWSLIDYYGVPKLGYWRMKERYNPVLVSLDYPLRSYQPGERVRGELWVINDLARSIERAELSALVGGEQVYFRQIDIAPDSSERIGEVDFTVEEGKTDLVVQLEAQGQVLDRHSYAIEWTDEREVSPLVALAYNILTRLMR